MGARGLGRRRRSQILMSNAETTLLNRKAVSVKLATTILTIRVYCRGPFVRHPTFVRRFTHVS